MMIVMNVATSVVLIVAVISVTASAVLITAIKGIVESVRIRHESEKRAP